jgi:hypothetical protein
VKLTLFSIEEANREIEEIRPEIERLATVHQELQRLERRISALMLAVSGAAPENPDAQDLRRLSERRGLLTRQLSQGVRAIQRRGCLVKDLGRGLVDFYAISGDRLIFLCWQLGEPEVAHWHALDGGFANRQPLHHTEHD